MRDCSSPALLFGRIPRKGQLDEIIVTASKRDEKLHDVAMSVTALGGDQLALRQLTGFQDWAAQVPGLSLQTSDPAFSRLILRGQNVGSVGATIATTVDDIPFFMSGAQADGAFFSANVDTYDLQRIEVLRGPQGTLYGAAAEGGIIKYVTNPPNLNKFEGAVSVGGESVSGGSLGGSVKGFINLPFWDNKAALRVSAVQQSLPGWIDNPQLPSENINGGDSYSLRASLLRPADLRFLRTRQRLRAAPQDARQQHCAGRGCRGKPRGASRQPVRSGGRLCQQRRRSRRKRTILSSMAH